MKRSRFTEEQIIGILREQEAGVPVAAIVRETPRTTISFHSHSMVPGGLLVTS